MQTFAKKLLWNPIYFLLNPYFNSAIMNFHLESFADNVKTVKTVKLFYHETFMVYGKFIILSHDHVQ